MSLLDMHVAEDLARVAAQPAEAFRGMDDDLFALESGKDYPGHPLIKVALPDYPSVEWVRAQGAVAYYDSSGRVGANGRRNRDPLPAVTF